MARGNRGRGAGYEMRERAIHRCLDEAAKGVEALKAQIKANPDDTDLELDLIREKDKLSNIKCTSPSPVHPPLVKANAKQCSSQPS